MNIEAMNEPTEAQATWTPAHLSDQASQQTVTSGRPRCGFKGCTSSWAKLWRRSGRPKLEGHWGCSIGCLSGLVDAAIRRELRDGPENVESYVHRVPLGLVFLAQGWITQPQLQHALAMQRAAGTGKIGDWLVKEHALSTVQVTRGLGLQWNRPVFSIAGMDVARMALVFPRVLVEYLRLLPVRLTVEQTLFLGSEDKVDALAILAIERMTGVTVESGLVTSAEYNEAMARLMHVAQITCHEEEVADEGKLRSRIVAAMSEAQAVDARLVRVRNRFWLRMWLERGALKSGYIPARNEDIVDRVYVIHHT